MKIHIVKSVSTDDYYGGIDGFTTFCGITDDCSEKFLEGDFLRELGYKGDDLCKKCEKGERKFDKYIQKMIDESNNQIIDIPAKVKI